MEKRTALPRIWTSIYAKYEPYNGFASTILTQRQAKKIVNNFINGFGCIHSAHSWNTFSSFLNFIRLQKETPSDIQLHLAAIHGDVILLAKLLDSGRVHVDCKDEVRFKRIHKIGRRATAFIIDFSVGSIVRNCCQVAIDLFRVEPIYISIDTDFHYAISWSNAFRQR